jgi:hypothetical protein
MFDKAQVQIEWVKQFDLRTEQGWSSLGWSKKKKKAFRLCFLRLLNLGVVVECDSVDGMSASC